MKDEVVREYIRNQELEDMKEDNLTSKEYQDPFKKAQKIKAAHQAAVSNYTRLSDFSHAPWGACEVIGPYRGAWIPPVDVLVDCYLIATASKLKIETITCLQCGHLYV